MSATTVEILVAPLPRLIVSSILCRPPASSCFAFERVVDAENSIYMIGFKRIGWAQNKGAEMQFVGIDTRNLKTARE